MRKYILLAIFAFGALGTGMKAQNVVQLCKGEAICHTISGHRGTVQWQQGDGMGMWQNISGAISDTLCMTADTAGHYRAEVVDGTCAPVYSDVYQVEIVEVFADAGADTLVCTNATLSVGGSPSGSGGLGTLSYLWTPSTNLSSDTVANPMATVMGPMSYMLTVTDSLGCMAYDTLSVDTGGSAAPGSMTFNFTGAVQTFIVPPCVDSIEFDVRGAQGGANWVNNTNFGGRVVATLAVVPGDTLYIYVGQQPTTGTVPGWNGGGAGDGAGKGGGGASDVRMGGMTLNDRMVVGGAGGGAGYWNSTHVVGGVGGDVAGNGYRDPNFATNPGGKGATQSGAGADGTCINFNVTTMAGAFGQGGTPLSFNCGCEGYGGGGGWYGGAGSGNCRGGGGGSSYVVPAGANVTYFNGTQVGNGQVILNW